MKPRSVPGPTGSPNCSDPHQPRRTLYRAVHQHGSRRARRLGIQVVAHHDIRDALPGKGIGQPRRWPACGEQALHGVQCPDGCRRGQRNRIPHTPRAVAEHLQRLVVAGAPHLGGERGARCHQHPPGVVVLVEPIGGVVPVLRDCVERARWSEPAGPGQRGRGGQCDQYDEADSHPLVAFGMGERVPPHCDAARFPAAGSGPTDAPDPTRSAAVTAARVCGYCAAVCRPRRGTLEQQGRQAIPDHRSIPAPARRHPRAGW